MILTVLKKLSVAVASLLFVATMASATTFNVYFDSRISNPMNPPLIVGTGTFSFTGSLGDGTYYLDTLPSYNIDFTIGTTTFTNADINTSIADVLVVIYGGGTQFYFDNDGVFGSHGGSLDFDQGGAYLTTEPNYYGPPPLNLYQAVDSTGAHYFGQYGTVPEPGSLLLFGSGLMALGGALRRRFHS